MIISPNFKVLVILFICLLHIIINTRISSVAVIYIECFTFSIYFLLLLAVVLWALLIGYYIDVLVFLMFAYHLLIFCKVTVGHSSPASYLQSSRYLFILLAFLWRGYSTYKAWDLLNFRKTYYPSQVAKRMYSIVVIFVLQ